MRAESPRGALEAVARLSGVRPGAVVLRLGGRSEAEARAAAELTLTSWDPVSRQPLRTAAAVRLVRAAPGPDEPGEELTPAEGVCPVVTPLGHGVAVRERYEEV